MIRTILKLLAYSQAPKQTFSMLHPVKTVQVAKTPFDFRTAYAPRLAAIATALIVGPLAYRLGKRAGEGTLFTPEACRSQTPQDQGESWPDRHPFD